MSIPLSKSLWLDIAVDGVTSLRVLMWNSCVALVPGSLVLPISASHHDRIVRELQIPTSASSRCCSWLCARSSSCPPQLLCSDCCQSSSRCCSVSNHRPCLFPPSCGRMDGFERAEQDKQVDLRATDVRKSDPEVPSSSSSSSSSSSLSEDETRGKLRSKQQRPPWRYWRRTGPEPQHRQPGGKQTLTEQIHPGLDLNKSEFNLIWWICWRCFVCISTLTLMTLQSSG